MQRFASATAVASVVIALVSGILWLSPVPDSEVRYLATSIWCVLPLAWGLWAMLTPKSWLPHRLPAWGAILGVIAGLLILFVLDLPARIVGEPTPTWLRGIGGLFVIGLYYVLWLLVQRSYRALLKPS